MADTGEAVTVRTIERIAEIPAEAWDSCAGAVNPFVGHAFLRALEESGSATGRTGWLAQHLVAEDASGRVVGCVPLYLKSHSYGEYVFDHGWAEAYARAGGRYYPKLQAAVPFSPVPGPRLLARDPAAKRVLATALVRVARELDVSSLHVTFCAAEDAAVLAEAGFLIRRGFQYHWDNHGYANFDEFLARLGHSKRKQIRRERKSVAAAGVELVVLSGDALAREHWDAFFGFYRATSDRKWGDPYLTRDFFARLQATMAERVALVMARRDGRWIAGALNLVGADALYGRNWGCSEDVPFLHFEACYYQAIEFAIARRLKRVEAGAQGEHKLPRGYLPVATASAHWLRDPPFARAVADFLRRETEQVERTIAALVEHSPYKTEERT